MFLIKYSKVVNTTPVVAIKNVQIYTLLAHIFFLFFSIKKQIFRFAHNKMFIYFMQLDDLSTTDLLEKKVYFDDLRIFSMYIIIYCITVC